MKPIPSNTVMKWAALASEAPYLKFIEGMPEHWPTLPHVGDVLELPFVVCASTGAPIKVRVVQILEQLGSQPPVIAPVLARAHGH